MPDCHEVHPKSTLSTYCFHLETPIPIENIRNVSMKAAMMNSGKAIMKNILIA